MILYRILIWLLLPALVVVLVLRVLRGRESLRDLGERLRPLPRANGPTLWVHGASVGELVSARPLIEGLLAGGAFERAHVTANTPTGRDRVLGWADTRITASLAPLDLPGIGRRSLRRGRIAAHITLEGEFWPNRLLAAVAEGVPVALVAARFSERSAQGWARFGGLPAEALAAVACVIPQDAGSAERLIAAGIPADVVMPILDLKSLYVPPARDVPHDLGAAFARGQTLLAASTHEGEEEIVLDAFAILIEQVPERRLILAPRHTDRADKIETLIHDRGLTCARRSRGEAPGAQVYLADTMGEMPLWYDLAAVTFVGGSLVDRGGHTPFEPAAHGSAILHGRFTRNFADVYQRLDAGGGAVKVRDAKTLARAAERAFDAPELATNATGILAPDQGLAAAVSSLGEALSSHHI